jgi:hypothetical protein
MRTALVLAGLGFGLLVMGSSGANAGPLAQATATPTATATATPHCQIQMRRGAASTPTWQQVPWWFEQWGGNTC